MRATLEYENNTTTVRIRTAKSVKEAEEYARADLYVSPTETYKRRICCDKCFYIVRYDVLKRRIITTKHAWQQ